MDQANVPDMGQIKLRGYRSADFEAMFRLDELCFEAAFRFSRRAMRRFAEAHNALVVSGEGARELAGFCIVHVNEVRGEKAGYVVTLDVAAEYRRKGLAGRLMLEAEGRASAAGCSAMLLHVFAGNTGAISFYERAGYTFLRDSPNFYGRGVHGLVYRKPLG